MKTEAQLNIDILKITMNIRENYPELLKFLTEMTVTIPDKNNPKINIKILQEYLDSLESIVTEYDAKHKKIC